MDTNACYLDIVHALENGDRQRACELAELLQANLTNDDDYPCDYDPQAVKTCLAGLVAEGPAVT